MGPGATCLCLVQLAIHVNMRDKSSSFNQALLYMNMMKSELEAAYIFLLREVYYVGRLFIGYLLLVCYMDCTCHEKNGQAHCMFMTCRRAQRQD